MKGVLSVLIIAVTTLVITLSFTYARFDPFTQDHVAKKNPKVFTMPTLTKKMMIVTIGTKKFKTALVDNATSTAFKAMLPMSIKMTELNGNEKYFDLAENLPVNAANPGAIEAGELMLYGSKTLVLFYKSFKTSYNYTRLGKIENTDGLAAALGSGKPTVKFELE